MDSPNSDRVASIENKEGLRARLFSQGMKGVELE
jgi:hypothetical protein